VIFVNAARAVYHYLIFPEKTKVSLAGIDFFPFNVACSRLLSRKVRTRRCEMRKSLRFSRGQSKAKWWVVAIIILTAALAACTQTETIEETAAVEPLPPTVESTEAAGLPNPASVYCEEQGYALEMREGEGGTYGVCLFPDGSECDEWAYYRGECAPGDSQVAPEEAPAAPDETPAALAEDGWQIYQSEAHGYTFHFPADAILEPGHDPLQTVTVRGPMVEDDYWPMIFISHPQDREEFQIPEGTDLVTWLESHFLLMTDEQQPAAEIRLDDGEIAGTTAVHTRFERSPQSYAYDRYYFAHDGQLYSIVIIHTADKEDWELYNHFLESFQFEA
jgi:putative hemolysin